ncbi:MAG: hypothetical protein FWD55_08115, partial [Propionibacteriaceae bacterium]|nr:hypothetical protein [Propionibacteriaceae bacterium]
MSISSHDHRQPTSATLTSVGVVDHTTHIPQPHPVSARTSTVLDRVNPVNRLAGAMILTFPLLITLDWVSAAT